MLCYCVRTGLVVRHHKFACIFQGPAMWFLCDFLARKVKTGVSSDGRPPRLRARPLLRLSPVALEPTPLHGWGPLPTPLALREAGRQDLCPAALELASEPRVCAVSQGLLGAFSRSPELPRALVLAEPHHGHLENGTF